jgi:cytochrome b561
MTLRNTPTRYGAVTQSFHWLTVIFVGAAYLLGPEGRESGIYAPENASALSWHETLGILVIVILVLRLAWRLVDRPPQDPPMPGWMLVSSRLVHWALYALLAAAPLTAILGAWYSGHPIVPFGLGDIAPPVSLSRDFGRGLAEVHGTLGNIIIALAFLHAAAALLHHFVLRDRVLLSMLPIRARD